MMIGTFYANHGTLRKLVYSRGSKIETSFRCHPLLQRREKYKRLLFTGEASFRCSREIAEHIQFVAEQVHAKLRDLPSKTTS